jgi:hypothetical protein
MMVVEETASAAPKGQANLANSQAKEPQSDRTLERTPPRSDGVTDGEPVRANLSGRQDRDREVFFPVFFYFYQEEGLTWLNRVRRHCMILMWR